MFITHVSAHWLITVPEHVQVDALSKIRAERVHPLGVTWLHKTLGHVGARAMAAIGPHLGVTVTIAKVQEVCSACSKCAASILMTLLP